MRLPIIALAIASRAAHADVSVDLGGGLAFPDADVAYREMAGGSADAFVRAGYGSPTVQAVCALDGMLGIGSRYGLFVVRALAGVERRSKHEYVTFTARLNGGVDIAHDGMNGTAPGLAIEPAIGIWLSTPSSLGLELAVPIARQLGSHPLDFTSVDVAVRLVLRFDRPPWR
jgi:hypothetical protein